MKRELRYLVLKLKDMDAALSEAEMDMVLRISRKVVAYRLENNRDFLECVVVENDWPEFEPTWQAIENRIDGKNEVSPQARAIEHAEYLAKSAEHYLQTMNEILTEDIDLEVCTDAMSDARANLTSMIYEFRKRAARAA